MILQSDLLQTLPMTAVQMQMIMDSQEIYRKRLVKELIGLHIDWMKRFKWFDWNYDDLKADYEKRNYIRYYTWWYSDLPSIVIISLFMSGVIVWAWFVSILIMCYTQVFL